MTGLHRRGPRHTAERGAHAGPPHATSSVPPSTGVCVHTRVGPHPYLTWQKACWLSIQTKRWPRKT